MSSTIMKHLNRLLQQLLSLLCSSAVDLGWYSSPDGIACEDVKRRIFEDFKRGIRCANITDKDISETLIQTAYLGQAEACIQVLAALKRIYQGRRERASHLSEANGGKMRAPVNESSSSVAVNPEHEMTEFGEDTWKHEYEPTEVPAAGAEIAHLQFAPIPFYFQSKHSRWQFAGYFFL